MAEQLLKEAEIDMLLVLYPALLKFCKLADTDELFNLFTFQSLPLVAHS